MLIQDFIMNDMTWHKAAKHGTARAKHGKARSEKV